MEDVKIIVSYKRLKEIQERAEAAWNAKVPFEENLDRMRNRAFEVCRQGVFVVQQDLNQLIESAERVK